MAVALHRPAGRHGTDKQKRHRSTGRQASRQSNGKGPQVGTTEFRRQRHGTGPQAGMTQASRQELHRPAD